MSNSEHLDPISTSSAHDADPAVAATLVPDGERLDILPRFFGTHMGRFERLVYAWAGRLCPTYSGGYWHFYTLANGGFYMAPGTTRRMGVMVEGNGFEGEVSADAFGVVACLFALCQLCEECAEDRFIDLYHQLREFAGSHAEARAIYRAID